MPASSNQLTVLFGRIRKIAYEDFKVSGQEKTKTFKREHDITNKAIFEIIQGLGSHNYSRGPNQSDWAACGDVWEFGVEYLEMLVYVKFAFTSDGALLCLSFHEAEYSMNFPFKK